MHAASAQESVSLLTKRTAAEQKMKIGFLYLTAARDVLAMPQMGNGPKGGNDQENDAQTYQAEKPSE
jgi:hypothetical protein